MALPRFKDLGFFNGSASSLSFKDALSSASPTSVSFPDLKISSHCGLPALWISEGEIQALTAPFEFTLLGRGIFMAGWCLFAADPCGVSAPVFGLLAFSLPLFYWITWEVGGCLGPSSFPIYNSCFVEDGLVDFGEFISKNLRVYLACELVFFFVSSYKKPAGFFRLGFLPLSSIRK
ncbi:hypothetical protein M5K25_028045 [Dendrobium thyrsiflorum]|uniref:Uncharacterized protein n=1 Tax=Dendrobium thyrsiflorum TaxID=117978 RepID=A0ABD0TVJ0_DENTH